MKNKNSLSQLPGPFKSKIPIKDPQKITVFDKFEDVKQNWMTVHNFITYWLVFMKKCLMIIADRKNIKRQYFLKINCLLRKKQTNFMNKRILIVLKSICPK